MTSDALSMTFAAMFSAQVESRDLSPKPLTIAFHISVPASPVTRPESLALPGANDPSKRLMLPAPKSIIRTEPSHLAEIKRNRHYPHMVWLQISNPKSRDDGFIELALVKIFHTHADVAARLADSKRKIHEGPYTREVAKEKSMQVRTLAKAVEKPAPRMTYVEQRPY